MNKRLITPLLDTLFLFLFLFISIIVLVKSPKVSQDALQQQVVYQVVMTWDGKLHSDMDLWAEDPEGRVVGFSRREGGEGSLFSLNRDDLGDRTEKQGDTTIEVNEEIISFRGVSDGEYTINGHLYNMTDGYSPIKVSAKLVKIKPFKEIIIRERDFAADNEEHTFFRFVVDKGNVVETNELPKNVAIQRAEQQPDQESLSNE